MPLIRATLLTMLVTSKGRNSRRRASVIMLHCKTLCSSAEAITVSSAPSSASTAATLQQLPYTSKLFRPSSLTSPNADLQINLHQRGWLSWGHTRTVRCSSESQCPKLDGAFMGTCTAVRAVHATLNACTTVGSLKTE